MKSVKCVFVFEKNRGNDQLRLSISRSRSFYYVLKVASFRNLTFLRVSIVRSNALTVVYTCIANARGKYTFEQIACATDISHLSRFSEKRKKILYYWTSGISILFSIPNSIRPIRQKSLFTASAVDET